VRQAWHAYHLIGDVLRSDDLASDAAHDAAFLAGLRARLSEEPVVLAPAPAAAQARRSAWMTSLAVAAGFTAVAAVLVVTRAPATPSPAVSVASLAPPAASGAIVQSALVNGAGVAAPQVAFSGGTLIRDVQLDRYLAAHKQFSGSSALGVPSSFLRSATADASSR
jgi:sigma-E factor negative regulatory protein RseA